MRVLVKKSELEKLSGSALVVSCFQGTSTAEMRCESLNSVVAPLIESKEFEGKLLQSALLHSKGVLMVERVLLIGLGKKEDFSDDVVRQVAAKAVSVLSEIGLKSFSIALPPVSLAPERIAALIAEGAVLANYSFSRFKSFDKDEPKKEVDEVTILLGETPAEASVSTAVSRAVIAAESENYARELANTPANIATPIFMAEEAKKLAKECGLKLAVYDEKQLAKMGMNALLSVSLGSAQPPRLVVFEYNAGKKLPSVCIVGKGITFDSGGISIKPSKDMDRMKWDKSGACAVFGAVRAAAKLKLPVRLIGIAPFAENLPSGSASKPGDIVKASNGKTIEILNTDAEGRLALADALSFACKLKPDAIIDLATLTGAVVTALGSQCAAVLGDKELVEKLRKAGEETHERVWELPLWKDYSDYVKSAAADVANISLYPEAGTITGAVFLKKFVDEKVKWAHVDIAGVAWMERDAGYWKRLSATGFGVRLLASFLENFSR